METRYQRHIQINEVGPAGQGKIKKAKVLVIGVGGLGCPALQYLTAAGIGTLGIMDPDHVSISNLQRQILFNENDLGKNKVLSAQKYLHKLNPDVKLLTFPFALTHENAKQYISDFDIVTVDIVAQPSAPDAYPKTIYESLYNMLSLIHI